MLVPFDLLEWLSACAFLALPIQTGAQVCYGFGSFISNRRALFGFRFGCGRTLLRSGKFIKQSPDFIRFCTPSCALADMVQLAKFPLQKRVRRMGGTSDGAGQ